MDCYQKIRDDIKRRRKALGMTQKEFAERAGVSVSIVGKIEAGSTPNPGILTIQAIVDALEKLEREDAPEKEDGEESDEEPELCGVTAPAASV